LKGKTLGEKEKCEFEEFVGLWGEMGLGLMDNKEQEAVEQKRVM
jgi:hypothetical protein